MKEIQLTQGYVAFIDDEDYELVSAYKWFCRVASNTVYASTSMGYGKGRKTLHMHRLVSGNPFAEILIDHKDRNGLNNQKSNLRESNNRQNSANRTPYGVSKFLGVSKVTTKTGRVYWRAFASNKYLGSFPSEKEAAIRYNEEAKKIHGDFANLNKVA